MSAQGHADWWLNTRINASKYNSKYGIKYNIRDAATRRVTDRQTDGMFWYNYAINNTISTIYKGKLSQVRQRRNRIIRSSTSVHLRSGSVQLAHRAVGTGDERPIIGETDMHQHKAGLVTHKQIITTTTGTPSGGMAKEDIISDIEEKTSLRHRPELGGIIETSSSKHR